MKVSSLRKAEVFFGRYHTLHVRAEQGVAMCCGECSEVEKQLGAKEKSRRNKCDQEESRFPEGLCGDRCEKVVEDGFGLCGCGEDKPSAFLHAVVEVERRADGNKESVLSTIATLCWAEGVAVYADEHGFLGTDPIASARAERGDTVERVTSGRRMCFGPTLRCRVRA